MTRKYNGFKREAAIVAILSSLMASALWAFAERADMLQPLGAIIR